MTINIFLQLVSIAFRAGFICLLVRELAKTPYSLWQIGINKIRYSFDLFKVWIWYNFPMAYKRPVINEAYNLPWEWLSENSEYKWVYINLVSQIVLIFGLFEQFGLGQIETKSNLFFISSPMLSLSYAFVFYYLLIKIDNLTKRLKKYESVEGNSVKKIFTIR